MLVAYGAMYTSPSLMGNLVLLLRLQKILVGVPEKDSHNIKEDDDVHLLLLRLPSPQGLHQLPLWVYKYLRFPLKVAFSTHFLLKFLRSLKKAIYIFMWTCFLAF